MERRHKGSVSVENIIGLLISDAATLRDFQANRQDFMSTLDLPSTVKHMIERISIEVLMAFASEPDARIDGGVAVWYGAESSIDR